MIEWTKAAMKEIIEFVEKAQNLIDWSQVNDMINLLLKTKIKDHSILVIGMGRSGFVGKAFALRLMHLGFRVYVFGETITPAIGKEDVVVAISGSGETNIVVRAAEVARNIGATVIAITSRLESPLAKISNKTVIVPGRTRLASEQDYYVRQLIGEHEPLAPLGTLFEITAMILLDSIIAELMKRLGLTEEELKARHATIE
ncbi:MAG: 6-phospho-3-hexuloisomerase [Thermoprotei archaeon]|jgi:6-phospho-3-hexuloisomerase